MKNSVLYVTRTAILSAMLVVMQVITSGFGNTILTGTIVNFILIVAVMSSKLPTGITVAIISPVLAKLVGIGPFWTLIPFVAMGNVTLVLSWHFFSKINIKNNERLSYIISAICGAVLKFLVLYITIVKLAVPFILKIEGKKAMTVSAMFSYPQLFTALMGGIIAVIVLPKLLKSLKN